jgi:ribosomal protein S9
MAEKKRHEIIDTDTFEVNEEINIEEEKDWAKNETADFTGKKYLKAVGRRKQATAQVRLYEGGKGVIMVNGKRASEYFRVTVLAHHPAAQGTGHLRDFNFSIIVSGGGKMGQVDAVRLGIAALSSALIQKPRKP